jgi:NAD(P)-dependent dehydrogenase (short-subunit alcohol dehydrogenase family)
MIGKSTVVTGAGAGIGQAIALRFASEGANVLAVDLVADGLSQTRASSRGSSGNLIALVVDVSWDEAPELIVSKAIEGFGGIDVLINNAGIGGAHSVGETSDEEWDRFFNVNLKSAFRLSRAVLPEMKTRGGGRIVNISSVYGLIGYPRSSAYSASKAGLAALTRQMAADYGCYGINVNAIAPGVIETGMTIDRIQNDTWYQKIMCEATPVGRVGTPADIAGAAFFLCSEDASFICGHVLIVDGGWLATRYLPRDEK